MEVITINTKRTEYNKSWDNKNKEYSNYLKSRSAAKSFIRNKATQEDLDELILLITLKSCELDKEKDEK